MRILYVVTAAEWGGAPNHVLQLVKYALRNGCEVGIVAACEPRFMNELSLMDVRIFPNPYFVRQINPWKDLNALFVVFRAIKEFNPDIVHAHSTKAGLAARLSCAILKKPVIFTVHGWAFTEGQNFIKRMIFAFLERLAAKFTTKFICVSKYDKELAIKWKITNPDKITVIHNGVDPTIFESPGSSSIREDLGVGNLPIVVFVGRLTIPKDPFTLIEAVKNLSYLQFVLLVVGDGEFRIPLEKYVYENKLSKNIIFLGQRSDVPSILNASDIFVLSSLWEGLPYVVIEAMMSGLPVVATNVGGVSELVDDGITGFLVPPKDPYALADAIKKLIDDPKLRKKMGDLGRKKALDSFTLNKMLSQIWQVYYEVLRLKEGGEK